MDLGEDGRMFERFVFQDGVLIDFYQVHQIEVNGAWWPLVRYSWTADKVLVEEFPRMSLQPLGTVQEIGPFTDIWDARDVSLSDLIDPDNLTARQERYGRG